MIKRCAVVTVVVGIVGLACAAAFAMCGTCGMGEEKGKEAVSSTTSEKVGNTVCPVSGEKVNMKNPATVQYNGKVYNLCCADCIEPFKADPEKYIKKLAEQNKGE